MDVAYHMSHRKAGVQMFERRSGRMVEGIGHYSVQRVAGEKRITVECDTPYPCSLEHGMVTGVAGQVEPRAIVTHAASQPCRQRGSTRCVYVVSW
jgi:hypothetical protein